MSELALSKPPIRREGRPDDGAGAPFLSKPPIRREGLLAGVATINVISKPPIRREGSAAKRSPIFFCSLSRLSGGKAVKQAFSRF